MTDLVQTDLTGLHSEDCECSRCATGYRPSELDRATARRALALQEAAKRRLAVPPPAGTLPRPRLDWQAIPPAYTDEEKAELRRLREQFRGGK